MSKVVLGGGISGLSTAFYLTKKFPRGITLYEASDRVGGWIKTRENESGTLFEQGARTLRVGGPASANALQLIDEIGLSESVRQVGRGFKTRFFYIDNKLCDLPSSWTALVKKNVLFNEPLLYAIVRDLFAERKKVRDESVYDFIRRRFGKQYAEVLSAVICGIYAGNAREISVRSAMKTLFEKEQKYGSVCLGMVLDSLVGPKAAAEKPPNPKHPRSGAWSFDKGMESLPRALTRYLEKNGADIRLNAKCNRIEFKRGEAVLDVNGRTETVEHVYSTLPSKDLAKILGGDHEELRAELSKIPFVSVAVVNLEYEGDVLPMEAFGLLIPPNQKLPILGIIFDTCIFPREDKTVLTVMMGGRWFEEYLGPSPDRDFVLGIATDYVRKILGVDAEASGHEVSILRDCIPQYLVGHQFVVDRINGYITDKKLPLTLVGNSYNGVGIPDAILSARTAVESN